MALKSLHLNTPGQKYHDFELVKAVEIHELQCSLRELVHEPTGARVMHIANEDPENLFCLSFQTLPETSDGVAHILEHTVLCGSKKFPVKDPFFAMSRRSLNTYMNALTGPDFTCYPAATQVPKDFYNLLEVYLDAVFKPNLNEFSFLQEGHRLEFANPEDPHSSLEFKGVVYNEMKGAMASSTTRLIEAVNEALFPDLTYGINSGGDPKIIPQLTYRQLCEFHQKFYHPSRCLFFFYGSMPLEQHLDFIAKNALDGINKAQPLPPIPLQPRFKHPKKLELSYPIAHDEEVKDKTLIAFGWLTCHILEQLDLLALSILEIILMDTDASPLKMALLKSGLCKQVSAYINPEITEVPYVILLKGCNPEHADELESIIMKTLKKIVNQGIPLQAVENAIHQQEFHRSEITGGSTPFGLSLFMRSALMEQHGAEPEDGLTIHSHFEQLRKKNLEDPQYLTGLITKYHLNNPHFVKIVMTPDKSLGDKESEETKEILEKIRQELTEKEKKNIIKKSIQLKNFQKKLEETDINILPKVSLEDVSKKARQFSLIQEKAGNLQVFHHTCFTNEIVYADLIFDLPFLNEEELPYVRLLTLLMNQMGCGGRNYSDNLDYIQANIGNVGATLSMNLQAADHRIFSPALYLSGKALHRKASKLFSLIHDMASSIDFTDIPRLKEVILKHFTALQSSINQSALRYAIGLSASQLDIPSAISNVWNGLEHFWFIRDIAQHIDQKLKPLSERLENLKTKLLCLENPHLIVTCDSAMYDELKGNGFYGLEHIETRPFTPWKENFSITKVPSQGRIIASPVSFTSKVIKTVSYTHPDAPALNVASFLFDNMTLHASLREQGGAYGGGAVCNSLSGNFYFYSYRDPNISSTLEAFDESVKKIMKGKFEDSDLEEAKLEMIQAMDAPLSPGSRGELAYEWYREGKTFEVRQAFRDRLLSLKKMDVIAAVKNHILPNMPTGFTVVFAGKELLEKENDVLIAKGKKPLLLETV